MQKPYGTWASPISAQLVASQGLRLGSVSVQGSSIYWVEGRPQEAGRNVLVRADGGGRLADVTPAPFNVRTRVHEYGGGACVIGAEEAFFCHFDDQRIYRCRLESAEAEGVRAGGPCNEPAPVTPPGPWRFADLVLDGRRRRLLCVREDHVQDEGEPAAALVSIPLDGAPQPGDVLVSGDDFYASPRLSPDGRRLAWLSWCHPQMPWDGTELWVADVSDEGTLLNARRIAGGLHEAIYQPGWSPDGTLYFVSDRDGWWRLYRSPQLEAADVQPVLADPPEASEFGRPAWVFGTATWAFTDARRMVVSYTTRGRWRLATVDVVSGTLGDVPVDLEPAEWITATSAHAVLIAGSPTMADAVVRVELATGRIEIVRPSAPDPPPAAYISVPQAVLFPGADGDAAHAFYYPPVNGAFTPLPDERPPLIVVGHGGPTSAARAVLDLKVQFWTSRGFAVADVNYHGSSGYGRVYRDWLKGRWGIADVEDMVAAARHLAAAGKADPQRCVIRGASAGGFTVLAALAAHPEAFAAGACYYGVADLEALARDTHKFEAHYLDTLVGPYPAMREEYRRRSPIHHLDRIACPVILFQGLEDRVVPPNQSDAMAEALRARGLAVAYLTFEGEQHGFRKAETIRRCLEAELHFYGRVLGFEPADRDRRT